MGTDGARTRPVTFGLVVLGLAALGLVLFGSLLSPTSADVDAVNVDSAVGEADASQAQSSTTVVATSQPTTTTITLPEALGRSVVPPNSGRAPERPGDRGGWQQLTVLGVIVGGIGLLIGLAARDVRRKRARQA